MKHSFSIVAATCAVAMMMTSAIAQQPAPAQGGRGAGTPPAGPSVRAITQVKGDLYKISTGMGLAETAILFLVTPEGIIIGDPQSPEFAAWLKGELAARFPGRPVRFVLQSHYHWDHARGGGMYADTAKYIAHENFPKNLALPIRQARPAGETDDLDGDNRISREEAQTATRGQFDRLNGNGDAFLSQAEINADIRIPDITFTNRYTVQLGGKRVELIYAGGRHTSDLFDTFFADERVLFVHDYVGFNRLCCDFAFDHKPLAAWIASFRALENVDFDLAISVHWGITGTKADLVAFRQYLEDLAAQVQAGIAAGKSLDELKKTITLEKYKAWGGYPDRVPAVVESAYNSLTKYSK